MKKVIVIGAGVGGLAIACRLASRGMKVQVFETNAYPGGKLGEIKSGDFRFDAGPSVCTLPEWIDDVFLFAGKNPRDYWNYRHLDRSCVYFFSDATRFDAYTQSDKLETEALKVFGVGIETLREYLRNSKSLFEQTGKIFLEKSLHSFSTWANWNSLKALFKTPFSLLTNNLHSFNMKRFTNTRLVQVFDRFATYNGSDPFQAPAMMSVISNLEFNHGVFMPEGGMFSITKGLYKLALDLGVEFFFSTPAEKIVINNRVVHGIEAQGKFMEADIVISNSDVALTYRNLLKDFKAPRRVFSQERSSSAIVFYWGLDRKFAELDLHNIFFAENYQEEFNCIFKEKRIPPDPTVYVNITSRYVPEDAPPLGENWFVMVNVPSGENLPVDAWRKKLRESILTKLERILKTEIRSHIVVDDFLDPLRIAKNTGSWQGALYGTSSNSAFSAFLRHPNFHSSLKGLYFVGGTVHPGGGIPLCLSSAKIVNEMITN